MSASGEDLSQFDISDEEKDRLVAEVIRYILFKTYQSSGCPIKRDELTQIITKNYRQRALPAAVIDKAREKLAVTFGYELKELQRTRPSTKTQTRYSQQSAADMRSYIVVSQLPADVYKKYVEDIYTAHLTGFTFVIVSIVHLAGGKISEENLWHHMRRMGLHETDENHPALGSVKVSLEALVQQRYLQKDKVNGPEGNTVMYELAERALDGEVSNKIKEYITQIVNKEIGTVEVDDD
ncbi:Non-structural maintenance of chromosomes element 3-like protein [Bienertia sinuspersici]